MTQIKNKKLITLANLINMALIYCVSILKMRTFIGILFIY